MKPALYLFVLFPVLAACSDKSAEEKPVPGKAVAEQLDKAADQSGPVAAGVLRDAADEARQHPSLAPVSKPGSFAQDALQKAGNAEAETSGAPTAGPARK